MNPFGVPVWAVVLVAATVALLVVALILWLVVDRPRR